MHLQEFFAFLPDWLEIFIISAVPVIELRGSIPWGILALNMPYFETYILAVLGSMIPSAFILWLIPALLDWMKGTKYLAGIANWIYDRGIRKSESIQKYSFWGMFILVAIPLPGTGVWTGCLAASLIGMDFKKAILAAFLGTATAGIIVSMLVYLGVMIV
jgi:uncharacterized membrane protein